MTAIVMKPNATATVKKVRAKPKSLKRVVLLESLRPEGIHYPMTDAERKVFKTKTGKRLTPHQWAVYDFTCTIPAGKVSTYKSVATATGGSPRSVGGALRNNPFAPHVPCHRIIASNFFVGGFFGEWGAGHRTGTQYNRKLSILEAEGVAFSENGILIDKTCVV